MSARSIVRGQWPMAHVTWLPVRGPRQDCPVTSGLVSCSEMGGVLSLVEVTKSPCPLQEKTYNCSHGLVQFLYRMRIDLRCLLGVFKFV